MFRLSRIGQDKVRAALLLACLGIGMPAWGAVTANNQTVATNVNTPISINLTTTGGVAPVFLTGFTQGTSGGTVSGLVGGVMPSSVTYTPALNFTGTDTFQFTVSDATAATATGTITVNVVAPNNPPQFVASPSPVVVNEDTPTTTVDLTGMFTDADGDPLALTVSNYTNAALYASAPSVSGTTLTLNFGANRNGASTVTIKATDPSNASATGPVSITVNAVNDAPTVSSTPLPDMTVPEDSGATSVGVSSGFTDVDIVTNGDSLTYTLDSNSNAALVGASLTGSTLNLSFAPNGNGSATITIRATDTAGASVTDSFVINVTPVNDPPTLSATPLPDMTVAEDTAGLNVDLSTGFTDVDVGDSLTYSVASNSNTGLVTTSISGSTLNLTLAPNGNGSAVLTIKATDQAGASVNSTFTLAVTPVNDAPTVSATPLADVSVNEDAAPVAVNVASGFTDIDVGDSLTYTLVSNDNTTLVSTSLSGSTLTLSFAPNGNGSANLTVRATDTSGASVTDSFVVNVAPVNDAPTVSTTPLPDVTVAEDSAAVSVDLSTGFTDIDAGDSLTYSVVSNSNTGLVTTSVSGSNLTLTLAPNGNGAATLTIQATDQAGASVVDSFDLNVTPVNDAPTVSATPLADLTVAEDSAVPPVDLSSGFTDIDAGDSLTYSVVSNSNTGLVTASVSGSTLNLTLVPNANGSATLTVQATDLAGATVTDSFVLDVTPVNDAPMVSATPLASMTVAEDSAAVTVDVSTGFTDIDVGDSLTFDIASNSNTGLVTASISGSTLTLTLMPNANGTATLAIRATDQAGASVVDSFDLNVTPVNDAPTVSATPLADLTVAEDSAPAPVDLSSGFTDVDAGDTLTYTLVSNSNTSLLTASVSGSTLALTLAPNANGSATLTVQATDLAGTSATDSFVVTVTPVNDPPVLVASPPPVVVDEDSGTATADLTGMFSDPDQAFEGDTLTLSFSSSSNPTLFSSPPTVSGTTLTMNLAPDQNGTAVVTVTATDSQGATASGPVDVTVNPVNDPPTLVNPIADFTAAEDSPPIPIDLSPVFGDVDIATNGDSLTYTVTSNSNPAVITTAISGSTLTLTLLPNAYGTVDITVQATDQAGASVSDSFTVTITSVNDIPIAVDDSATMNEDGGSVTIDVLANDTSGDSPTTVISAGTTVTINGVDYPDSSESPPTTVRDSTGTDVTLPNGSVTVNGTQVTYTPKANYNGSDYFTYTIQDGNGDTATATVNITIVPTNDAPTQAGSLTYSIVQGNSLTVDPAGGIVNQSYDPDGDPISVVQDTVPSSTGSGYPGTTLSLASDGSFTYTPDVNFVGTDTFQIRLYDGTVYSAPITVTIDVTAAPPPPPPPPAGEVQYNFGLANVPLEDAISAEANVLVVMDDSGSMDWTFMTDGAEGEFWLTNAGVKTSNRVRTYTHAYRYHVPLATNVYGNNDVLPTEEGLAANGDFDGNDYGVWRGWNSQYNTIYYNPKTYYRPWVGLDRNNVEFGNVSPTAAILDPYDVTVRTIDLTAPLTYTSSNVPCVQNTTSCRNANGRENVTNSNVYLPRYYTTSVSGRPAWNDPHTLVEIRDNGTIYAGGPKRDDCAVDDGDPTTCTYAQEIQNFANWFTYFRSREYTAKAALGRTVADVSNVRVGYVTLNDSNERIRITSMNSSFRVGAKRALMNQIYKIDSNNGTPLRSALDKAGRHFECRAGDSFGSTSNTSPGNAACPISPAPEGICQNNYTLLFSDGTWNGYFNGSNWDGDSNTAFDGVKFSDTISDTLADVAMHYYERDLQPTLEDGVPTTLRDQNGAPASAFGNSGETMHQHMKTYTVAFGLKGLIDPSTVPVSYATPFSWGDPFNDGPAKVDDMLHAATNGRGEFLQANDPVLLSDELTQAFQEFSDGSVSVSAVAFNSTALREQTIEYRGFFNLKYNTGDLRALTVDPATGMVDEANPVWRAASKLDTQTPTGRVIVSYDRINDTGVPFRYANLNTDQRAVLSSSELDYLRGDRSNEEPAGTFRQRPQVEGLLGDIVHSAPQFVGAPRAIRRDQSPYPLTQLYSSFKDTEASRPPLVYIGANDGMLHGFDAQLGTERMAYVPNKLIDSSQRFKNVLDQLTSLSYSHKFFVDVTPTIEDVFMPPTKGSVSKQWSTVLVGALGGGGKGYYALNVTDPATAYSSESSASSNVLWEFTDADDTYPVDDFGNPLGGSVGALVDLGGSPIKDLGYAYSPAQIAMSNIDDGGTPAQKQWIAVFGNGYNSTAGIAKLFVLPLENGLDGWQPGDFYKLNTNEGVKSAPDPLAGLPNGLGTPTLVDVDLNGTADIAYAGDLFGNLYRFNISSSNPALWKVTKLFQATYTSGGVTTRQPITTQPYVIKHPTQPGFIIIFGTGSWITDNDGTSTQIQSVYGIWDRGEVNPATANSNAKSTRLVRQTVTNVVDETNGTFQHLRIVSDNPVDYAPDSGATPGVYGWYFDFNMPRPSTTLQGNANPDTTGNAPPAVQFPGERAIRRFVGRGSSLLITTVIPRDANTCLRSPPGSTFPIDALTGGNPQRPILDLNNDGVLDSLDFLTVGGVQYAAGILFDTSDLNGQLVDPSLLLGTGDADFLFLSGGDEQLTIRIAGAEDAKTGRLSWRELDGGN